MPKASKPSLSFNEMLKQHVEEGPRRKVMDRASERIRAVYGEEFYGQYVAALISRDATTKLILATIRSMDIDQEDIPLSEDPVFRYRDELRKWNAAVLRAQETPPYRSTKIAAVS